VEQKKCSNCEQSVGIYAISCPNCQGRNFVDLAEQQPNDQLTEHDSEVVVPSGDVSPGQDQESSYHDLISAVAEIRRKAQRQILYGLLWWSGSAIAMYFALTAKGSTTYWYGGALGALFHWYRAFKMHRATLQVGAKTLVRNEILLIGLTFIVVLFTTAKIAPEWMRVSTPTVGTCWAPTALGHETPVACWSHDADAKTVALVDSLSQCPTETTNYFSPSDGESQYTCIIKISA